MLLTEKTCGNESLFGLTGELVLVRVSADPRHLEEMLEVLATLDFPVNPELLHEVGSVVVEFPAYGSDVEEVRKALDRNGFNPASVDVRGVLYSSASLEG